MALLLLGFGIALAQLAQAEANARTSTRPGSNITITNDNRTSTNDDDDDKGDVSQNQWIGLLSMAISCITSGMAGVYFEWMLKKDNTRNQSPDNSSSKEEISSTHSSIKSEYIRNIQLAIPSFFLSAIPVFAKQFYAARSSSGFFEGYDWLVWGVIANQALGGLLVSKVMKYADSNVKVFAVSISVILSSILSSMLLEEAPAGGIHFWAGAALVIASSVLYSFSPSSSLEPSNKDKKYGVCTNASACAINCGRSVLMRRCLVVSILLVIQCVPMILTRQLTKQEIILENLAATELESILEKPPPEQESISENPAPEQKSISENPARTKCTALPEMYRKKHIFDPPPKDIKEWMTLQRLDGSVLVEDHHDQYARVGPGDGHRLARLIQNKTGIEDDDERMDLLQNILRWVDHELVAMNITYTLWSGTLLGAYRHHALIPWDDDIDIAIIGSDDATTLRKILIDRAKSEILKRKNITSVTSSRNSDMGHSSGTNQQYQWVLRAKKDSDIILAKVAELNTGYYVDVFHLYRGLADVVGPDTKKQLGEKRKSSLSFDIIGTFWEKPRCFPIEAMLPSRPCVFGSDIYQCVQDPKIVLDINYPSGLGIPKEYQNTHKGTLFKDVIDALPEV
eukprot:CAMPEP_0183329226 /NCGR_PEP_ID=MMETSP0160_2-20130417/84687_1 /TAXON_ID=2839 ORGANISM="Odontella Sinensis, Strain Grunow 1884" /NCGR_SAMPLE_ID=MMETSP0160_2 /ASSEMBLY_ACC=CAM_ASM_000250 /LENGTH=625 /DNA_ID=CAMNT_0025497413 /DNA_START=599 /DNA_END=2476 /DNA_ORIENTATION=-